MTTLPRESVLTDCLQCLALLDDPHLTGACASVGIAHDVSTAQVLTEYLTYRHRKDHQQAAP